MANSFAILGHIILTNMLKSRISFTRKWCSIFYMAHSISTNFLIDSMMGMSEAL